MSQNEINPGHPPMSEMDLHYHEDMKLHRLLDHAACALDALRDSPRVYGPDRTQARELAERLHNRAAQIVRTWD